MKDKYWKFKESEIEAIEEQTFLKGKLCKELTPLEKNFISWYEITQQGLMIKIHKFIFRNCKRCKINEETYKEILEKGGNKKLKKKGWGRSYGYGLEVPSTKLKGGVEC